MLSKMLFLILGAATPWVSQPVLSTVLATAPKVQMIEEKKEGETLPAKIDRAKEAMAKWVKQDPDVMSQFDLFCQSLEKGASEGLISDQWVQKVLSTAIYAAEKHQFQVKSNGKKTPYIIHPIEVADLVMRVGHVYDPHVLMAALLHDVLDDTGAALTDISKRYGQTVAHYVEEMTDNKQLSLKERKKAQIVRALHQDPNVAIIKFADKLSNLGTLLKTPPSNWSRDKIDQYFQWAQSVVENLPVSNEFLKKAVKQVIADYWEAQNKSK
jgi:guanosine-3',5'-bis(diphosphate) 3'-pyrophosphohydrolase